MIGEAVLQRCVSAQAQKKVRKRERAPATSCRGYTRTRAHAHARMGACVAALMGLREHLQAAPSTERAPAPFPPTGAAIPPARLWSELLRRYAAGPCHANGAAPPSGEAAAPCPPPTSGDS